MDYFIVSSDYPDLVKAVEEIFINVDTVDVVTSSVIANRKICDMTARTNISTIYDQSISY